MKAFLALAVLSLMADTCYAQQGQSVQSLQLTNQELALVGKALGKLPFEESAPVIGSIQRQIDAAQKKEVPPKIK